MRHWVSVWPRDNGGVTVTVDDGNNDGEPDSCFGRHLNYRKDAYLVFIDDNDKKLFDIPCGEVPEEEYFQAQADIITAYAKYIPHFFLYFTPDENEARNRCIAELAFDREISVRGYGFHCINCFKHTVPYQKDISEIEEALGEKHPGVKHIWGDVFHRPQHQIKYINKISDYLSEKVDGFKDKAILAMFPQVMEDYKFKVHIHDFASIMTYDLTEPLAKGDVAQCNEIIESLATRYVSKLAYEDISQEVARSGLKSILSQIVEDEKSKMSLPSLPKDAYHKTKEEKVLEAIELVKDSEYPMLDLPGKGLTCVPESIGDMTFLEELNLCNNKITEIPDFICNLPNLRVLMLRQNKITVLPDKLGIISNLEELDLSINNIEQLPESFSQLKKLKLLDLMANPIQVDLEYFRQLPEIEALTIDVDGETTEITKFN